MNCDCNDKNCGGLTPLIAPKIKHVFGNVLRLAIPLTLRSLVKDGDEMVATDTDFIPSSEYPVNVVFTRGKNPYAVAATMDGNLAVIEDKGKIPLGTYDITVECRDDGGLPYRFKQNTVLQVVDVTAEAGIDAEIEYETTTWYLDAAVFLATTEIGSMSEIIDLKLEDVFGKTEYDANAKLIRFFDKSGTHELATIDSRPFIVDGTVQDVYIDVSRQVLVVVLNEDAGGRIFTVPLYLVFGEYYKKTEVESMLERKANINGSRYDEFGALEFDLYGQDETDLLVKASATVDHQDESVTIIFSDAYNYGNEKLSYTFDPIHQSTKHIATEEFVEDYVNEHGGGGGSIEQVQADWNEDDNTDPAYIKNKPTIPDVSGFATTSAMNTALATKQDVINDLSTIRSGAAAGATAAQPSDIPANTSDLINDSGFVASTALADVATSGSYADLLNKPTIPAAQVAADWNQASSSAVDYIKNKPTIPTKVSDLTNDSAFVTANDVSGIVAASGDLVLVESADYVDLFIYGAEVTVSPSSLALYAAQKSSTITVAGSHLKADIAITVPTGFTASPSTIAHANGTVSSTSVTITYTGADASTASGSITATAGEATASIPVAYTQYSGPTIVPSANTLSVKAGAGSSNTGTITVNGFNLEGNITAAISGTDASKFSVSPASLSPTSGTVSGGSLTVTYSPAAADSGTHSATLTLSSTNATSVTISLGGAVSTITTSESALTMTCQKNSSTTATFDVEGENLSGDLSISASGTGLSVDTNSITATDGEVSSTTITVTFAPTATGTVNGTITISDGVITKTISVTATATGVQVKYNDNTDENTYIEWEAGQIDATTGADYMPSDTTKLRCRTKDYLPCAQSVAFNRNYGNAGVVFYDENKVYKGYHWFGSSSGTTNVPDGAVYFRAYINNANLADVAKQYTTGGPWLTDSRRTSGWGKGGIYTTYEP